MWGSSQNGMGSGRSRLSSGDSHADPGEPPEEFRRLCCRSTIMVIARTKAQSGRRAGRVDVADVTVGGVSFPIRPRESRGASGLANRSTVSKALAQALPLRRVLPHRLVGDRDRGRGARQATPWLLAGSSALGHVAEPTASKSVEAWGPSSCRSRSPSRTHSRRGARNPWC